MTPKSLNEALGTGLIATAIFIAAIFATLFTISLFGPKGDAAFGFALGIMPSLFTACIVQLISSLWLLFSYHSRTGTFRQKLRFYLQRILVIDLSLGALIVINAVIVQLMFGHRH